MNRLNFLNREIETTPRLNLLLVAGTTLAMLSPISMFSTWNSINQLAFKAILAANIIQANRPNRLSKLFTAFNPLTLPYFIGLSLYSAYADSTYGLKVQLPKVIDTAVAIREKLPSQSQVMEMLENLRSQIPSQMEIMGTIGTLKSKIPSQNQALEAIRQLSEQIKSNLNITTLTEIYRKHAETKTLILIPAIAAVALLSIGAYRCCRKSVH